MRHFKMTDKDVLRDCLPDDPECIGHEHDPTATVEDGALVIVTQHESGAMVHLVPTVPLWADPSSGIPESIRRRLANPPVPPPSPELQKIRQAVRERSSAVEGLARAYMEASRLPPEQVALVVVRREDTAKDGSFRVTEKMWFQRRQGDSCSLTKELEDEEVSRLG